MGALLLSLLIGCDQGFSLVDTDHESGLSGCPHAQDIECTTDSIDFGTLSVVDGESASQVVTCFNYGLDDLHIEDLTLSDDAQDAYSVSAISSTLIQAEGSAQLSVTYAPTVDATDVASIIIESNDPDEPSTEIDLLGDGIAPALEMSPSEHDFGAVPVGCIAGQDVEIRNVGREVLVVGELALTDLGDFILSAEALPWSLAPDEAVTVTVEYLPTAEEEAETILTAFSNDPAPAPAELLLLSGIGLAGEQQTDTFIFSRQPIDVLILSKPPVPDSITVTINGVSASGWTHEPADNTIAFPDGVLGDGVSVVISYTIQGECD